MHKLKEFLIVALAASRRSGSDTSVWEGHLSNGFNAFLGGRDIFHAIDPGDRCYALLTIAESNSVLIHAYGGNILPGDRRGAIGRYPVVGYGVFMRCALGDRDEARKMIEGEYHMLAWTTDANEFRTLYGKKLPYRAATDASLIDFSRGVVDILEGPGSVDDPLTILVNSERRLLGGSYHDLRRYGNVEELLGGLYGAWNALVSESEQDWERFIQVARPAIIKGMDG